MPIAKNPVIELSNEAVSVFHTLRTLGPEMGISPPAWPEWRRGAAELIDLGFAEEVIGFFALTAEGRAYRPEAAWT